MLVSWHCGLKGDSAAAAIRILEKTPLDPGRSSIMCCCTHMSKILLLQSSKTYRDPLLMFVRIGETQCHAGCDLTLTTKG